MMRKTNPSIADEEVAKIISEVDLDGDGTINFDGTLPMGQGPSHPSTRTESTDKSYSQSSSP